MLESSLPSQSVVAPVPVPILSLRLSKLSKLLSEPLSHLAWPSRSSFQFLVKQSTMSNVPRDQGTTCRARKDKKKVRRATSEPAGGSSRPTVLDQPRQQHDRSGSPQATIPTVDSSAEVSWPVFPPCHEHQGGSSASSAASGAPRRPFLWRDDTNGFKPNLPATSMITSIIRNRLDTLYATWNMIPETIRRDWFNEWRMLVDWDPVDEDHMWGAFNFKGGAHFHDIMSGIRKTKKRRHWMGDEFYGELIHHPKLPTFLQMSKANKEKRKSPVSGSLYAGGNVSAGIRRDRMGKELGRKKGHIYDRKYFSESGLSSLPRENIGSSRAWEALIEEMQTLVHLMSEGLQSRIDQVHLMFEGINQRLARMEEKLDKFFERFSQMVTYPPAPQPQKDNDGANDDDDVNDVERYSESGSKSE